MLRKFTTGLLILAAAIALLALAQDLWLNTGDSAGRLNANLALIILILLECVAAAYLLSARRWQYRYLLPVALLCVIGAIVGACSVALVYVDAQLERRSYAGIYNDCHKVWGARGLVPEGPNITRNGTQNSIESISLSLARGARGNEVDVHFDLDRGEFIVSHDFPYNFKNGALLTLEALFETTGENGYTWLDFKKLRHLDQRQLAQSVAELQRISAKGDLKNRIYVEGEAPLSLAAYRDAGFHTIFDTHPVADANFLSSMTIGVYKLIYYFGDFSVMAMNYGEVDNPIYGKNTRLLLGDIPVFVYHVADDSAVLGDLVATPAVKVILVQNHSLDRYGLNACAANS